jgi:hypothetical protein
MNRPDFVGLVEALKEGKILSVAFKPAKPRNIDGVRDQKVVDVCLAKMEHYLHAYKLDNIQTWNLFSPI